MKDGFSLNVWKDWKDDGRIENRRYEAGWQAQRDGLYVRGSVGKKLDCFGAPGNDVRLDVRTDGWIPYGMGHLAMLVAPLAENESVLYRRGTDLGGEMLHRMLCHAITHGVDDALRILDEQKRRRRLVDPMKGESTRPAGASSEANGHSP